MSDYHMDHRPPGPHYGAPLHDLAGEEHGQFGDDVYDHPDHYGSGQSNREMVGAMRKARGNPNASITIYRALPKGHAHIDTGDWVTTSAEYARQHGTHATDPDKDMPVIKANVPAHHLWTSGDELSEFGYHGPPVDAQVHFPGGKHAQLRKRGVDGAPLAFSYDEQETGGSKYPIKSTITARHPDHGPVGRLTYYPAKRANGQLLIGRLEVPPEHRRKGIGSAIMDHLQERHPRMSINHGDRTNDGKAWWSSYGQGNAGRDGRTR